jgi:TPR repeat protein
MRNLGLCYRDEIGCAKDASLEVSWLRKAAAAGNEAAIQEINEKGL